MFGVCMIVKNEENVIERAMRSVLRTVDTWCIVDTGSTDKTKEIIQRVADELGKTGHLYDRKWVNFGHNRSEALTLAKKHMKWCLMIDADDTLEGDVIDSAKLDDKVAGYNVTIKHLTLLHTRVHLFNMSFDWQYRGAVHEHSFCKSASWHCEALSPTTWIHARTEGSRSNDAQKYHKDAILLQTELKNPECDKARTLFYLAQSYRDSDNKEQAIKYYKQRAVLPNSWSEEQYVSYLNLIRLSDSIDDKIKYAWTAQNLIPTRRECVGELLHHARLNNIFTQELYAMGLAFKDTPIPNKGLFLEPHLYGWMYDEDIGLEAFYTGHFQQAADSLKLSLKTCPDWAKNLMAGNLRHALTALVAAHKA
jgi:glycosyltransferase involved in cell wall biosynthesis